MFRAPSLPWDIVRRGRQSHDRAIRSVESGSGPIGDRLNHWSRVQLRGRALFLSDLNEHVRREVRFAVRRG